MSSLFNITIGARIRHFRKLQGLSQQELGEKLGISFQQVQKYETGMNTLSFERMCKISEVLQVPVTTWLEPDAAAPGISLPRQEMNLLRSYHRIPSEEHKTLLCAVARALAESSIHE